jgi:uncharacterized protein YcnI
MADRPTASSCSEPDLPRRTLVIATLAAIAFGAVPAAAQAHIQVRPAQAAPLDPVLWTVLVPNERSEATVRIELQVPPGVSPFSFEETPGWKRTLKLAPDQSIERIVWTGRVGPEGLAHFTFLATTPEEEGTIAWKALQIYEDGEIVRWIGDEGAEEPASFTSITEDAPRENAGGEGAEAAEPDAPAASQPASTPAPAEESAESGDDDLLPLVLAGAALLVAIASLAVSLKRTRSAA